MTDETLDQDAARERVAIEVEHHEPAYAQVIYDRRVAEMEREQNNERKTDTIQRSDG